MKNQEDLAALAKAICETATSTGPIGKPQLRTSPSPRSQRYAEDYGPASEPGHARMFGIDTWDTHSVGLADYVLTMGVHPDDHYLLVGTVPQSRDYYGGPLRMEWSDGWQEKVGDEYLGLSEIAYWIVNAVDY